MSADAPHIRLHILPAEAGTEAARRYACRLLATLSRGGRSSYVYLPSAAALDAMDEMLWSYEGVSFVPHSRESDPTDAAKALVHLGTQAPAEPRELLFNFCATAAPWFAQFPHIVEVIATEQERSAARQRWQEYRSAGAKPEVQQALSEFPEAAA